MSELFDQLLISSPNGGGLFVILNNSAMKLDSFDSTGICMNGGLFLRGEQPSSLWICGEEIIEISNETLPFDDIHDVLYFKENIYIVNTTKNEIIELNKNGTEIRRWSLVGGDDSSHVNCLAVWNKRIVFSAFGDFVETRGYKDSTKGAGYVQDLVSGERLIVGLSQPHSLVPYGENLLIANSEEKEIREYATSGELIRTKKLEGYTRGIYVSKEVTYVGLSRTRNIEEDGINTALLVALNSKSWDEIGRMELPVNEIYSVVFIKNTREMINIIARVINHSTLKIDTKIAFLSDVVVDRDRQIDYFENTILDYNKELEDKKMDWDRELKRVVNDLHSKIGSIEDARDKLLNEKDEFWRQEVNRVTQELGIEINNLNHSLDERDKKIDTLVRSLDERSSEINDYMHVIALLEAKVTEISQVVTDLKLSKSWRITRPLRFMARKLAHIKTLTYIGASIPRSLFDSSVVRIKLLYWYWKLKSCPYFDISWYLEKNPDVEKANINPLWHFLVYGWKENRNPGPEFDNDYYRDNYPDVAGLDQPLLVHYWLHGRYEGRNPNSLLDVAWLQREDVPANHSQHIRPEDNQFAIKGSPDVEDKIVISVIIPTYNRIKLLPGIIDAWREVDACTLFRYEIIFSDDESSDDTVKYLESVKDLPLRVLSNKHGGASHARNAAIQAARGERLLIIGDDIFPDKEILNIHAELGQKMGSKVAILGTVDWHDDLHVNHLMRHITEIGNEQFSYNRLKDGSFVDFRHFYTCNISVSRRVLLNEDVIFDERFDEYGFEDVELGYRLALRGIKTYFTTQAKGAHFHPYALESFCRRQTSAGRMAVVFSNIHPGVEQVLGVTALSVKARNIQKSSGEDELWHNRIKILVTHCEYYENILAILAPDVSVSIRQCLSLIYSKLFRAMYEYGVLNKQGDFSNALAISMNNHFGRAWDDYWEMIGKSEHLSVDLDRNEIHNLSDALNNGNSSNLLYGHEQRAIFDELLLVKSLNHLWNVDSSRTNKLRHYFSRAVYYIANDPRYLIYRAKKAILDAFDRQTVRRLEVVSTAVVDVLPALVLESDVQDREKIIELFLETFGESALVYERISDNVLIPSVKDGVQGEPILSSSAEATVFYWPTSMQAIPPKNQLICACMALVENKINFAVISQSLVQNQTVSVGDLRDHLLFSRNIAESIFNRTLFNRDFRGKILRLLPSNSSVREKKLEELFGVSVDIDDDGFFERSSKSSKSSKDAIFYKRPYFPAYSKKKPVVFVFPIFLAVGGVERNTIEIMRQLCDRFDFVVVTMERLRLEQGSLAAQAYDVSAFVVEMSEIVLHDDYPSFLVHLRTSLQPDLVWVCNGSPWFCDNAKVIRDIFNDVPIIDQEVYDTEKGWITRYDEAGIQSFDHFIAVNKKIKDRFLREFKIDSERCSLIYSAIDTARIKKFKSAKPDKEFLKSKLGLPKEKKIFTFIARLSEQKRPLLFLDLAKRRLGQVNECFVLVGDGELAPQALNYIKKHDLKNVIRIPYIENTLELNAISNGIIFTSAYEGLPIAMLEALAMGVPAFSTDVGDIADVLTEYEGGEVISASSSGDELLEAFVNWLPRCDKYSLNLKKNEHKILDRFSSKNIAEQYVVCWEQAMVSYNRVLA